MIEPGWPLILLAIRLLIVLGLYGFVLITVRALRAELRARTMPAVASALPARIPQRDVAPPLEAPRPTPVASEAVSAPIESATIARPRRRRTTETAGPRSMPPRPVLVALYACLSLVVVGGIVFALRSMPASSGSPTPSAQQALATPAPGHVTVSLLAHEDTSVRVTVDGTVQFDSVMRPNERRSWDGKSGIDVWTDKGRTLGLAVDGRDLGPYSPAMGHPDWNRIDYSFWPGWSQSLRP